MLNRLSGALVLLLCTTVVTRAQESSAQSTEPTSGAYVGGYFGALGGSLWSGYDLVDGSGSHFAGFTVGFVHRRASGLAIGGEGDVSFGAEPRTDSPSAETTEVFGSLRARLGYSAKRWFTYGTSGLAWTGDQRVGWTIGAGIERSIGMRWSAGAEYLYSRFADADDPRGVEASAPAVGTNQVRIGLRYALGGDIGSAAAPLGIAPLDADGWNAHAQTTLVSQYAAPFHAPYRGANSLDPNIGRETWDVTFYLGRRLWRGAALWINPEVDQGYGLSNTLGVAGFTSGEAYKVGYTHPYVRLPRAFVQQTIDLGGAGESVEAGPNQFQTTRTANRLVATVGKFSVSDLFDTIGYAHDPRTDFMNWALVDSGTFDYAADAWGFTYGAAIEWYQSRWAARAGVFDLSVVPNSVDVDSAFRQYQIVYELERQHTLRGRAGKVSVVGFVTRGRMGSYLAALADAAPTGATPNTADVRRFDTRPGVNVNFAQQITADIGLFGRAGWADGSVEAYEFTDIDRTVSAGVSIAGMRWSRPADVIGIGAVVSAISDEHRAYLAAGGLGILVGDGRLPHPGAESILESYYRLPLGPWQLTVDYQLVVNPAFNTDRGPVSVIGARIRTAF